MSLKSIYTSFTLKSIVFSIVLIIFIIGLIDYLLIDEKNGCEMTFMFQFPQFVVSFNVFN